VAYLLRKRGVPMAPLILGFVLGDMMEQNLRRALSITNGELGILVGSPICIGLWVGAAAMVLVPPMLRIVCRRSTRCTSRSATTRASGRRRSR
jgi:putative tricarboxylic transport membrane protein